MAWGMLTNLLLSKQELRLKELEKWKQMELLDTAYIRKKQ